jgi:methylated-DNA-[protein]-cysteine S-methyltransferase
MYTTLHPSPVGDILLKADTEGRLTGLFLLHDVTEAGDGPFDAAREQLDAYFAGELEEFDLPLALNGTEFQLRVWDQLARIPFAETISYKELALRLGDLKLVRAVGLANGRNPVSIIVPCHRVIGADGTLRGYGGGWFGSVEAGLDLKRELLLREGLDVPRARS